MIWTDKPESEGYHWILFPDADREIGGVFFTSAGAEISYGIGASEISLPVEHKRFAGCKFQKVREPDA